MKYPGNATTKAAKVNFKMVEVDMTSLTDDISDNRQPVWQQRKLYGIKPEINQNYCRLFRLKSLDWCVRK